MAMSRVFFGLMYRIGFVPWEGHKLPARLLELVEGSAALPAGKALDIGCGTGDTSIYLGRHGWDVTAIDFVKLAIDRARAKTDAAGVKVRYIQGDATRLAAAGVGTGFQLLVDNGCMHVLSDEGRDAYTREASAAAAAGARFILTGFSERKRRGPRGINRPEVARRFAADWEFLDSGVAEGVSNRPDDPIYFYDLRRR